MMNGFIESCTPFFKRYAGEILLLCVATIITIVSFVMFTQPTSQKNTPSSRSSVQNNPVQSRIMVEVSGSVVDPGVYELSPTARLIDALKMAKGLSPEADASFFSRNYNLARYLTDQDKIYIPSLVETQNNLVEEPRRLIDYTAPKQMTVNANITAAGETTPLISINTASSEELQTLSGIGTATAQKMIDARPYGSPQELVDKKVISAKLFDQIIKLIRL